MPGKARTKVIEISQIIPFSDDFKDAMTDALFFFFFNVILTLKSFCYLDILKQRNTTAPAVFPAINF